MLPGLFLREAVSRLFDRDQGRDEVVAGVGAPTDWPQIGWMRALGRVTVESRSQHGPSDRDAGWSRRRGVSRLWEEVLTDRPAG